MEGWIFMDRFDYHYLTMHHVATAALLLMSHYVNTLEYGSLIILVHDAPNIATQLLVLLTALQEGPLGVLPLVVAYISSIVFWIYFMLWVFPYQILYLPHRTTRHYDLPVWQWHWFFGALLILHHLYVLAKLLAWIPTFLADPKGAASASGRDKSV